MSNRLWHCRKSLVLLVCNKSSTAARFTALGDFYNTDVYVRHVSTTSAIVLLQSTFSRNLGWYPSTAVLFVINQAIFL